MDQSEFAIMFGDMVRDRLSLTLNTEEFHGDGWKTTEVTATLWLDGLERVSSETISISTRED